MKPMFEERELATLLAALRFWQRHGPGQPNSCWDRLEIDEQDALDEIRTGSGSFTDLDANEIDCLCQRLNCAPVEQEREELKVDQIKRFVLYDEDLDRLSSTTAYADYQDAAADVVHLDNVIVVPLHVSVIECL